MTTTEIKKSLKTKGIKVYYLRQNRTKIGGYNLSCATQYSDNTVSMQREEWYRDLEDIKEWYSL